MMRTMRASAKWIMGAVAISFVGWMVFDVGMDVGGRGGGGPGSGAPVRRSRIDRRRAMDQFDFLGVLDRDYH